VSRLSANLEGVGPEGPVRIVKEIAMHPDIIRLIADEHLRDLRAEARAARRARRARAR
jgi:hypothetical protein